LERAIISKWPISRKGHFFDLKKGFFKKVCHSTGIPSKYD